MSYIYAMSDIHGYLKPFTDNLEQINLHENDNTLVLCGDYIDYGNDSCEVLYKIKELTEQYPTQVTTLMGNHEYMFLEFLSSSDKDIQAIEWLRTDYEFRTINTFITKATRNQINSYKTSAIENLIPIIKNDILNNHHDLLQWLKKLPFYYETENQIFVHAGIDEEAEEYWMHGTPNEYYVSKYPATFGKFYKDIIAGHISTSSLANDKNFHSIFWDKKSHYFIDGETHVSGVLPLLKYDTVTKRYNVGTLAST